MKFNQVAVLYGGTSAERDVSLASGTAVVKGLREAGYDVTAIDVQTDALPELPSSCEAVFIALHGAYGEDGQVQRALKMRGMPYIGSDEQASQTAFDKVLTKQRLVEHKVPTPAFQHVTSLPSRTEVPLVMKPPRQGSSVGVHIVKEAADVASAFADIQAYSKDVLIEAFIPGRELTVAVVCNEVLPIVEINAPEGIYDYRAKYTAGTTSYSVPAPLPAEAAAEAAALGRRVYEVLGCRDLSRVDIRMDTAGRMYVLEINTIPGFTENSLVPKAAAAHGWSFPELCSRIMEQAELK